MTLAVVILAFTLLLLPAFYLRSLWYGTAETRLQWFLRVLSVSGFLAFLLIIGRWDFFSYYLRYLWIGLLLLAIFVSYRRVKSRPLLPAGGGAFWRSNAGVLVELLVVAGLLAFALSGLFYPGEAVRMAFPLRDGRYYVGQGGNSVAVNYHNTHPAQRYALDIVALNPLGLRSSGIFPAELDRYAIYGHTVYSPCAGQVIAAVDGLPEQEPPAGDRENPAGNHVVIDCQGVRVVLAHMQPGSLRVSAGDPVAVGQPLGLVGNSGNTTEPHLHIHAVRGGAGGVLEGEGVPLLFDGRFLTRNAVVTGADRPD